MSPFVVLPIARLTRSPRAWVPVLGAATFSVLVAVVERAHGSFAADRALLGVFGPAVLPLVCFALARAMVGGRLEDALAPLALFGGDRRRAALYTLGAVAVASAVVGGVLAGLVQAVALFDARNVVMSLAVGAVGGAAYAAMFVAGSSFGAKGGGMGLLLAADLVLGGLRIGFLVPRTYVVPLLGGTPALPIGVPACSVALVLVSTLFVLVALRRAEP